MHPEDGVLAPLVPSAQSTALGYVQGALLLALGAVAGVWARTQMQRPAALDLLDIEVPAMAMTAAAGQGVCPTCSAWRACVVGGELMSGIACKSRNLWPQPVLIPSPKSRKKT